MDLKLTLPMQRILKRIELTIQDDLKNGIEYEGYLSSDHGVCISCNNTELQLDEFRKFRARLELGTHPLMDCTPAEGKKNLLILYDLITDYCNVFTPTQRLAIENVSFIEDAISKKLKKYFKKNPNDETAISLRKFLANASTGAWGPADRFCEARFFKSVESMEEFNKIIEETEAMDISDGCEQGEECIKIAFYRIYEEQIINTRGLKYDWQDFYQRFIDKPVERNSDRVYRAYKALMDIKNTGMYYVYIPNA